MLGPLAGAARETRPQLGFATLAVFQTIAVWAAYFGGDALGITVPKFIPWIVTVVDVGIILVCLSPALLG